MLPTGRTRSGSAAVEGGGVGWLAAALLSYILSEADHRLSEVEPPGEVTVSFWVEARGKWGRSPFKRSSSQTNIPILQLHLVQQQPQGQEAHSRNLDLPQVFLYNCVQLHLGSGDPDACVQPRRIDI